MTSKTDQNSELQDHIEKVANGIKIILKDGNEYDIDSEYAIDQLKNSDYRLNFRESALVFSAKHGLDDITKLLVDQRNSIHVDLNAKNFEDKTTLYYIAEKGNEEMAKLLLNNGANVEGQVMSFLWEFGNTPLTVAVKKGHQKMVQLLLDAGARINYGSYRSDVDGFAKQPISQAVVSGNLSMVKYLLDRGSEFHYDTAILLAARECKSTEMILFLLDNGANPNAMDDDNTTLLHYAVSGKGANEDVVRLLLDRGAKINARNFDATTPLHMAAKQTSNVNVIELLLERGANICDKDKDGNTCLHFAAQSNDLFYLDYFIKKGIDVNVMNRYEETPLYVAVEHLNEFGVQILLNNRADINVKNVKGKTVIDSIFEVGLVQSSTKGFDYSVYKLLLRRIALMEGNDEFVSKPLMAAIEKRSHMKSYFMRCKDEVKAMKNYFFKGTSVTYFDVLKANDDFKIMNLVRDAEKAKSLKSYNFERNFEAFGVTLIQQIKYGMRRNEMLANFNVFFHLLSVDNDPQLPKLPYNCLTQIFSYISNKDLASLSNAKKIPICSVVDPTDFRNILV